MLQNQVLNKNRNWRHYKKIPFPLIGLISLNQVPIKQKILIRLGLVENLFFPINPPQSFRACLPCSS